ncbi:MAG: hypothetical protein ACFFCW_42065, partial [Candidatus Hodarchaeota archaeon]
RALVVGFQSFEPLRKDSQPIEFGQCGFVFETGGLEAGFDEPRAPATQLILHQAGKNFYKRNTLIGLNEPGLQRGVHAMEPKRIEMSLDFS